MKTDIQREKVGKHVNVLYCAVLVAQLCPTLCDPMDCSPPGSFVHEISQARILEILPQLTSFMYVPATFSVQLFGTLVCAVLSYSVMSDSFCDPMDC